MRINREKELINRLIDILEFKKVTYQSKLTELDRKREIEGILSKYPGQPYKGIIELDVEQIITLLSYFTDEDYDKEDIDIKKYWMQEAYENESLKETKRYKEANRLFEKLTDKLQEYLETLKGIDISEEETVKLLDLCTSLSDHLKDGEPIVDLSIYYPVLMPSETLTEDDIYSFLVSLSINNVLNIDNYKDKSKTNYKLSNEIYDYLKDTLERKIAVKEDEKEKNIIVNEKLIELSKFIEVIKKSNDAILDYYPDRIRDIMSEIFPEVIIEKEIRTLMVPITVIKGKKKGLKIDFETEDLNILQEYVKLLTKEETKMSEYDKKIEREKEEKIVATIDSLTLTLSKLVNKNLDYYNAEDFYNVINLMKEYKQDFEYIKNIIVVLNALNFKLRSKLIKNTPQNTEELFNNIEVVSPEDNNKKEEKETKEQNDIDLEKVFFDNGLNYTDFPEKLIANIKETLDLEKVVEMIQYISSKKELDFLKEYTYNIGENETDKYIHDIKCGQIYFILAYSNTTIIDNLIKIAEEYNVELKDIFAIPKVFASVESEVEGSYENFLENIKLLATDYPEVLVKIVRRSPSVLATPYETFRNNIELTETYGMNIETDLHGAFPSPRALATNNFESVMDKYIEAQEYDYIERFRSQLETNSAVTLRIKYLQLKGIDYRQGGYFDITNSFNKKIYKSLEGLSIENIPVGINDELIKKLEKLNEETDESKKNIQYVINGIYISRIKVIKVYSTLLINNYTDKLEALLYSMVKDSYITKDEFKSLKEFVYEKVGN